MGTVALLNAIIFFAFLQSPGDEQLEELHVMREPVGLRLPAGQTLSNYLPMRHMPPLQVHNSMPLLEECLKAWEKW